MPSAKGSSGREFNNISFPTFDAYNRGKLDALRGVALSLPWAGNGYEEVANNKRYRMGYLAQRVIMKLKKRNMK